MNIVWPRRVLLAATGLAWFIWLGVEDRNLYFLLALALMISLSLAAHVAFPHWARPEGDRPQRWPVLLQGGLFGAAVPLLAVLLMFIKVSLHRHAVPDFTLTQVFSLLAAVPVWATSGALMSAAWLLNVRPNR